MKRKFLSLALVTAFLALVVVSSAVYATTNVSPDAEINVSYDDTLTISLSGQMSSATISGISAAEGYDSASKALDYSSNDYISVVDYTGASSTAGHYFQISFDSNEWTYNNYDSNFGNASVSSSIASTDVIVFQIGSSATAGHPTELTWVPKSGVEGCSYDLNNAGTNNVVVVTTASTLGSTTETCPGETIYTPGFIHVQVGSNGIGQGAYTITGTVVLTDGPTP